MSVRLYIVDDEAPARERLAMLLTDIAADCPHVLVGMADNAQAALDGIAKTNPDIVLLDVQMPGMTGLELAHHLANLQTEAPAVIFVTAHDEFALKAFDVHALDYLLKPVRAARLAEAIQRAVSLREAKPEQHPAPAMPYQPRRHFSVQERGRLLLVPVNEVMYLKAELKYVTLRTRTHAYLLEESLTSLEHELAPAFVRVHRNALVARTAILGVERVTHAVDMDGDKVQEGWVVILRDIHERLPISRRQWAMVKAWLARAAS